jgi:large conductance mechanosensitive channel
MVAMLKGFRDFVTGGNLIEVAVGLIMALALFGLVQALIADLITPLIAAIFGEPNFGDLSFTINGSEFRYGDFINALITFVSVAAAVYFFIVVPYQKYQRARESARAPSLAQSARWTCRRTPGGARTARRRWAPPRRSDARNHSSGPKEAPAGPQAE